MKNQRVALLGVCFTLFSLYSAAQKYPVPVNEPDFNKPKLFQDLPEKISADVNSLTKLFSSVVGSNITTNLAVDGQFVIEGQVISAVSKYENTIQSIIIRATNFNGARLTISRITNTDRSQSFTGRLLSLQHGDLYELKYQDGHFAWIKRKLHELVNE
jgi:hypothetical protein